MEKLNRPSWDPLRDERLDLPPQPKYAPRFPRALIWSSTERTTTSLKTLKITTDQKITYLSLRPEIKIINFPKLREEIKEIFEKNLGIEPESITLYKSPEDGEERIIVSIELGQTDSPLKKLLEIKRKLRRIDRDLASKIVLMPAD